MRKYYPEIWFVVAYNSDDEADDSGYLNFTAYKICGLDEYGTNHKLEDEPHLTGHIKFDGCADFNFRPQLHFCGSYMLNQHQQLLAELYKEAQRVFNDLTL